MDMHEAQLYQHVGAQVRARRNALNLTQAHLADDVGLLRSSVANIEAGRQRISLHVLYQVCAVLDLDVTAVLPPVADIVRPTTVSISIDGELKEVSLKTAEALKQLLGADL